MSDELYELIQKVAYMAADEFGLEEVEYEELQAELLSAVDDRDPM